MEGVSDGQVFHISRRGLPGSRMVRGNAVTTINARDLLDCVNGKGAPRSIYKYYV